jgi:hypothetical protein
MRLELSASRFDSLCESRAFLGDFNDWNQTRRSKEGIMNLKERIKRIKQSSKVENRSRFCSGNTAEGAASPEVLIVFIHGWNSRADSCWLDLLADLDGHLGEMRPDILLFAWPAKLWHHSYYAEGAKHLVETLRDSKYARYRQILFVVHSAGGLLIKSTFLEFWSALETKASTEHLSSLPWSVLTRSRFIVNLAVPHDGASTTLLGLARILPIRLLAESAWRLLEVFTKFKFAAQGDFGLGRCGLTLELTDRSKLRVLPRDFQTMCRDLDAKKLPRAVSVDFQGRQDASIKQLLDIASDDTHKVSLTSSSEPVGTDARYSTNLAIAYQPANQVSKGWTGALVSYKLSLFPGGHSFFTIKNEKTLVASRLFDVLRYATFSHCGLLADRQFWTLHFLEREVRVKSMAETQRDYHPRGTFQDEINKISQYKAVEILTAIRGGIGSPHAYVITGQAGVGKTTCLRRFCLNRALEVLQGEAGSKPLPVYVPVFRYRGAVTLDKIINWWSEFACEQARALFHSGNIPVSERNEAYWKKALAPEQIFDSFRQGAIWLVLDGVDECIAENPNVNASDFDALIRQVLDMQNNKPLIILGIRVSVTFAVYQQHSKSESEGYRCYEIRPPKMEEVLDKGCDPALVNVLKLNMTRAGSRTTSAIESPLLAAWYDDNILRKLNQALTDGNFSEAWLFDEVLRSRIRQNRNIREENVDSAVEPIPKPL